MRRHYEVDDDAFPADAYKTNDYTGVAVYDPEDITPLEREAYCGECGQIGCCHDGLERDAE